MSKVLLVEDSIETSDLIKAIMPECFFQNATTLVEAREAIKKGGFDLVLLDLHLPDGKSFELCAEIRNDSNLASVPILFLSADENESCMVTGFSVGADDYVVKPVKPKVFRAKMMSILNKKASVATPDNILIGKLDISPSSMKIRARNKEGTELDLTPLEYRILLCLVNKKGQVVTRDRLLTEAWGASIYVTDRVVDQHISLLRKKVGEYVRIKTIYGTGYQLEG